MGFRPGLDRTDLERILEREIRAGAPISAASLRRAIADAIEANNRALWDDLLELLGRHPTPPAEPRPPRYVEDKAAP